MRRLANRRIRRALAIAPGLVLAWTVVAFLVIEVTDVSRLSDDTDHEVSVLGYLLRGAGLGLGIGALSAWLETGPLPHLGRRLPFAALLLIRTLAYALIVLAALGTVIFIVAYAERGFTPPEVLASEQFRVIVGGALFRRLVVSLVLSSFVVSFGLQLRRVLGPEVLRALFLGRYRRPVEEQRVFLFLDLADSTAIAERLGPLAFTDFKNDFFADVAEPVLATGGRIVQYVGDEVMVAWPMKAAVASGAPLRFFALVDRQIGAHAERYRQRYGVVPGFKAGCHGGTVVTAEVGDLKRDIVHSGDVVNTAARIEAECRPRGRRLLVSQALVEQMPLPDGFALEPLGPVGLRGKAAEVHVCAVVPAPEAAGATA